MTTKSAQQKTREMQKQTFAAIQHTINKIANIEGYEVHQIDGVKIKGPMKWIVLVFGPNNQAKDLKNLMQEYNDLNIIVILIKNNEIRNNLKQPHSQPQNQSHSKNEAKEDSISPDLKKLCKMTPEGYMIVIEQKQFEGRESNNPLGADMSRSHIGNKSAISQDLTGISMINQ